MPRVISIDPGKNKCGLVLAEISEKKVYKAIVLNSELLEGYVRNLNAFDDISKIIIGNGTACREIREKLETKLSSEDQLLTKLLQEGTLLKKLEIR